MEPYAFLKSVAPTPTGRNNNINSYNGSVPYPKIEEEEDVYFGKSSSSSI